MIPYPDPKVINRWDDFWIGADHQCYHAWGGSQALEENVQSWGGWCDPRFQPRGAWDPTGQYLTVEVIGSDGKPWVKCLKFDGTVHFDWVNVFRKHTNWQPVAPPTSPTTDQVKQMIQEAFAPLAGAVTQDQINQLVEQAVAKVAATAVQSAVAAALQAQAKSLGAS